MKNEATHFHHPRKIYLATCRFVYRAYLTTCMIYNLQTLGMTERGFGVPLLNRLFFFAHCNRSFLEQRRTITDIGDNHNQCFCMVCNVQHVAHKLL